MVRLDHNGRLAALRLTSVADAGARAVEAVRTDAGAYGGSDVGNLGSALAVAGHHGGQPAYADVVVPPLATLWFRRAHEARRPVPDTTASVAPPVAASAVDAPAEPVQPRRPEDVTRTGDNLSR